MYYYLAPCLAWLIAGGLKFAINRYRFGTGVHHIGNGGFPSNHTSVISATTWLIGFEEGFTSPIFGLGVAVVMIVIFDATGLRNYVGQHANRINKFDVGSTNALRERIGHTKLEVLGGLLLGLLIGFALHYFW